MWGNLQGLYSIQLTGALSESLGYSLFVDEVNSEVPWGGLSSRCDLLSDLLTPRVFHPCRGFMVGRAVPCRRELGLAIFGSWYVGR